METELQEVSLLEEGLRQAKLLVDLEYDMVRDIGDKDLRRKRLDELRELRGEGREADKAGRDAARKRFVGVRDSLENKLRNELRQRQ
mmetsp:Transcript_28196/g.63068  ORF Transcript_28196/g.63068 Transcript_28196/m.63068 type:complete len:87 (+) Transcript_28196:151-411(+)